MQLFNNLSDQGEDLKSPSMLSAQKTKQSKGSKYQTKQNKEFLHFDESSSDNEIKPKNSEFQMIAPMNNPFKGAEMFKIQDEEKEREHKRGSAKRRQEEDEKSLQGMLMEDETFENAMEELANTNRPLIQFDKEYQMDTSPVEFEKPKQVSPAKMGEQNLKVEREQPQEWNIKLIEDKKNIPDHQHESLEPEMVPKISPDQTKKLKQFQTTLNNDQEPMVNGATRIKKSSNHGSSIKVHQPINRAQSGTDKQFSTNPIQKLNNDDTISGDRELYGGFISDRKNIKQEKSRLHRQKEVGDAFAFKEDVDFLHQIAYCFERSYGLKMAGKEERIIIQSNKEIKDLINGGEWIIKMDPMTLFYCLYFCVYYENELLKEYLFMEIQRIGYTSVNWRQLMTLRAGRKNIPVIKIEDIQFINDKIPSNEDKVIARLIETLMKYIFEHGLVSLNHTSTVHSMEFYHAVFYEAIDGQLRIVYDQILGKLKELYLRDKDALLFIKNRDFKIIEKSFEKTTKSPLSSLKMHREQHKHTSYRYRTYSRAYYQELIIKNDIDERTRFLFAQKFLKENEDINSVLEMYCQIDDLCNFVLFSEKDEMPKYLSAERIEELFLLALKSDSLQIAFHINQNYRIKYQKHVICAIQNSIRDTQYYLEIKMFFVKQSFVFLNVTEMDALLTLFQAIFQVLNPKKHPLVNCYNPVKCSMLVYEICWEIQQKNIYSLQRKCHSIMKYLTDSLCKYFDKQGNINHLFNLMREPVLHPKEQKDSMDMMLHMGMDSLIQHKVVEEVLNLVYDGKYSIDASPLYLSSLYYISDQMDIFAPKSVFKRLLAHIDTMGSWRQKKQSSVQFHIWKQCIRQREMDEMIFLCIVSFTIIYYSTGIDDGLSGQYMYQKSIFDGHVYHDHSILTNADPELLREYCEQDVGQAQKVYSLIINFMQVQIFCAISYSASIVANMLTVFSKQNIALDMGLVAFEGSMVVSGYLFRSIVNDHNVNTLLSDSCRRVMDLTDDQAFTMDKVFSYQTHSDSVLTFQLLMSFIVSKHCLNIISVLRRTEKVGPSIIMMLALRIDLSKFTKAFLLPLITILLVGMLNAADFTTENLSVWEIFTQLFSAFTGEQDFSSFKKYAGQTYLVVFIMLYFVLLLNLLIAMFSNTYQRIYENENAIRLSRILEMKNHLSYDPIIGAVTSTFFPINVIMIPAILPLIIIKNRKLNEMANKAQYAGMIFLQSFAIVFFQMFMAPLMYLKIVINQIYIMNISKNITGIQRYMDPIFGIIASPFIILIAILVDIITLPTILLRECDEFEMKYQQDQNQLDQVQLEKVNTVFDRILDEDWYKYKGMHTTYIEMMNMHRSRFKIMENLNDLLCKGSKDYKESLNTVNDFNRTKVLTRICSVPSSDNDITQNRIYFDMLKIIRLDIEIFNHVFDMYNNGHGLHADFKTNEQKGWKKMKYSPVKRKQDKQNAKVINKDWRDQEGDTEHGKGDEMRKRKEEKDKIPDLKLNVGKKEEVEDVEDELISDQFMRDPTDVMTFFQTNMLCEAFTDTGKFQLTDQEKTVQKKIGELYNELRDTITKSQIETMDMLDKQFGIKSNTNNRLQIMIEQGEGFVISTQPFMDGILENSNDTNLQNNDRNEGNEIRLDYQREGDSEEEAVEEGEKKEDDEDKDGRANDNVRIKNAMFTMGNNPPTAAK